MSDRLAGKVCVVTGGSRGIGLAMVEKMASEGARVACLDVSARRLEECIEPLRSQGHEVRGYVCDISQRAGVASTFTQIEGDFSAPVGVLVNNAVWARFQPLQDLDEEVLNRMLAVGLNGIVWTMQAVVPQMIRRGGGSIINLSSTSALRPLTHAVGYAALKSAVLGLTRAAAVELSPSRIRVNAILPGMVGTPASLAQFDAPTLAARQAQMPLGRFGNPEEMAALAVFLASDESSYIQGAEIVADGGWTVAAT
jgi:NAD(P)-dependent dehydrogenase (short-subunit alcohol dehydrogenase family)